MADKEDREKEEERRRRVEAELFSKTMGFTHTPSPEELERTVILNPITRKPEKQQPASQPTPEEQGVTDFESTVRFTTQATPEQPATPPPARKATAPQTPGPKPTAKPAQGAQPAKPAAAQKPAKPVPAKPAAAPKPAKPAAAQKPAKPAPAKPATAQKPAKQAAAATPSPKAAPITPDKPTPPQGEAGQAGPEKPAKAAPKAAAPEPQSSEAPMTPPATELDFSDGDLELADIEFDTPETPETPESGTAPPAGEPAAKEAESEFDSAAALDELDELLKMDMPEISGSGEEAAEATAEPAREEADLSLLGEEDMEATDSRPTVQLGAGDLVGESADEDEHLSPIMDDELAKAVIPDNEEEGAAPADAGVEPELAEPENLIDLSGLESSLDEAEEKLPEEEEPASAAEPEATPEQSPASADERIQAPIREEAAAVEPEPQAEISEAVEPQRTEAAAPEVRESPRTEEAPQPQAAPEPRRKGSGFAIFLSLLAIAGVGGLYWLNQGAGSTAELQNQLTRTTDRVSQLEKQNRGLASELEELKSRNVELEQQLGDLTRLIANRQKAARAKAASHKRPVIQPSTPVRNESRPVAKPKGWVINLTSVSTKEAADQELARLKELGIEAEAIRTQARGRTWYRIRVGGFESMEEAEARSRELGSQLGIADIWVGRP